jgi:hypothetical protein
MNHDEREGKPVQESEKNGWKHRYNPPHSSVT